MKKVLLAAILAMMTTPAFAFEAPIADQGAPMTPMASQAESVDAQALPWPFPRPRYQYTCFARDRFGRTYWGRGWNRSQAQRMAYYACQRSSGRWNRCYMAGCRY